MKLRILLADDHQMFREALRILLERNPDFEIVAETGDGLEVLALARDSAPNIICLDIDMPGLNGIEITRQLAAAHPTIKIIALSVFSDRGYIADMLSAGASAYVTKAAAGAELLRAIDAVSRGRSYLCPDATDAVKDAMSGRGEKKELPGTKLGAREIQVLKLVALGLTSGQIGERLEIALSTVEVHRRNIMRKLDVDSAIGLTRYAIRTGLVSSL
ncbi:response regulator [Dechloromonas denitrificans]|uniref:response regulator n=1 Tax=Dechloromonas denitrificans TaxID=281362 RepID=UPI001CF8B14F|nr:response regulator transcription factor [Dechloromonas denitrificans]UCV05566.1 response regulator transcription factor [Dechloromonas denitrificans]